jgi:hypothetical protein
MEINLSATPTATVGKISRAQLQMGEQNAMCSATVRACKKKSAGEMKSLRAFLVFFYYISVVSGKLFNFFTVCD